MYRLIFSFISLALCALCAPALSVRLSAPGTLAAAVDNPAAETILTVEGPVDASDFYFIARNMPQLRELDLSAATISEYKGDNLVGRTMFPACMIPQGVLADSDIERLELPTEPGILIGDGAFAKTRLRELVIGANVVGIGDGAFALCPELATVTIASPVVGTGAFADCPALTRVSFTAPAAVGGHAFAGDAALVTIDGAAGLTSVGDNAFFGCTSLTAFSFGPQLSSVGSRAFSRSALAAADLSQCSSTLTVGDWAFAEMPALATLDVSAAASVGEGVVFDCPALGRFVPSASSDSVAAYAYAKSTALSADGLLPDGIRVVGAHALHGLSQLSAITIPAGVEELGSGAMAGMTGLQQVTTEAVAVPALGDAVWRGVDQSSVTLNVPYGSGEDYAAAAQWQDFSIYDAAGIEDVADNDTADGLPALKARFVGPELQVSISGIDIERLALHDVNGMLLIAVEPQADFVAVDTSDLIGRVFIVSAVIADGRTATVKLARN